MGAKKEDKAMEKFCQSCGMPLTEEAYGTEKDGSKNVEYCHYCYEVGSLNSPILPWKK